MERISLHRPDDWHIHLRDGEALERSLSDVSRVFGRALAMPNLSPPVCKLADAEAYRQRILAALPRAKSGKSTFEPFLCLYLTDLTRPEDIFAAARADFILGAKLYPAGVTTHSDAGVRNIPGLYPVFEAMSEAGMTLQIHGEDPASDVDSYDKEKYFLIKYLKDIVNDFPKLLIVLEHISTRSAVEFVSGARAGVAATITAHHLLYSRSALYSGGLRPHLYCLPLLKRESHRQALVEAATGGNPRFFLGTDSAPHPRQDKLSDCGCAGIYSAHAALELYAEVFAGAGVPERLEDFASHFGADFYALPRASERITLVAEPWRAPERLSFGGQDLVPLRAGEPIGWRLED